MSVCAEKDTAHFEGPFFKEPSTRNRTATREEVLTNLYFTKRPIVKPDDVGQESQIELQSESAQKTDNVVYLPQFNQVPKQIVTPFTLLQEWEGYVQSVGDNEFTASLFDITNKRNIEDEEADFFIDDLNEDDKSVLKPGAVFRWLIGYRWIGGTKERISKIVFRRLPQWTDSDLQAVQEKAKHISSTIKWE